MGKKTNIKVARFDALIAEMGEEEAVNMVCSRITEGETLYEISKSISIPYNTIGLWLTNDADRVRAYQSALRLNADRIAQDCLYIADGINSDGDVARDKLRIDTRLKLAASWDSSRYGKRDGSSDLNLTITVDRQAIELQGKKAIEHRPDEPGVGLSTPPPEH